MVYTILKDFTFVGSSGQQMSTDWIAIPTENKQGEVQIVAKLVVSSSQVQFTAQTSFDTDSETTVGSSTPTVSAAGTTPITIFSGLGPLFRINMLGIATTSYMVISVYFVPKIA